MRYNLDLLNSFCNENQIVLSQTYSLTDKLAAKSRIEGYCKTENCNELFDKSFENLMKTLVLCKKCSLKNKQEKIKNTCIERYGVSTPLKNEDIKTKIQNTNIERYGVQFISQNENIKSKIKNTNLEKYGGHPTQHEQTKKKKIKTNLEKYGVEFVFQNEIVKGKIKDTIIEKYGVQSIGQNEKIKDKKINTCLQKYGCSNPFQSEIIKDNIKEMCLEKFGVLSYTQTKEFQEKCIKTSLEKYGCSHPMKNSEVRNNLKKVMIEKYGVEHSMQHPEFSEKQMKSSFHLKDFTFPSGKIIQCQGYEPFGLKELIENEKTDEEDILTDRGDVPSIWYNTEDGKTHRHYVDIYIISQKRCIEIKSEYTFSNCNNNNHILLKQESGKKDGYLYEIWVFNNKGLRTNIIL